MSTALQQRADGRVRSSELLAAATDCTQAQSCNCDGCGKLLFGKRYAGLPHLCKQCRRGTRLANGIGMKPKIICRFCGQLTAKRMTDPRADGYKPVLYPHKCPHGCDCFGGQHRGKGQNWAVLVLGNKDVAGCRKCYERQLAAND